MPSMSSSIEAPPVNRVIALQIVVLAVLVVVVFLTLGMTNARSFLLGGLLTAVPNAWFMRRYFRHRGASASGRILRDFYTGKAAVMVFMGAGFALIFLLVDPLNVPALFSGFILTHIAGLLLMTGLQQKADSHN